MGRAPCCDKANVKKGPWSPEEDAKLKEYIEKNGTGGNWIALPQKAGLKRCGKSCRLRWLNYLRPNIKHGEFSDDEDRIICTLYANIGSRWSIIAAQLPGRTDNDIKNYWNTKLKKKLFSIIPQPQNRPFLHHFNHHPNPDSYSSFLQSSSPSSPSPSSSSTTTLLYNCNNKTYHNHPATSFSGFELSYTSSSSSSCITGTSIFQPYQESFLGPMQQYQLQDNNNGFQGFGTEASCSSSDGSNGENNGDKNQEQFGIQSYNNFYNEAPADENQKLMGSNDDGGMSPTDGWSDFQKSSNGLWGETPLDYGLEEIKQLISATTTTSCNSFIF